MTREAQFFPLPNPDTSQIEAATPFFDSNRLELLQSNLEGYLPESKLAISSSFAVASLHNLNENEGNRRRKFDDEPYFNHPYAIAMEASRMKMHPTIIIAGLIHDIAEDVRYGGLNKADHWIKQFETLYAGYEDKERLMRILKAELKTEGLSSKFTDPTEKKAVIDYYSDSYLGKTAKRYLRELRGLDCSVEFELGEGEKEDVAEVLFDLNRLFSESYIEKNGEVEFDPSILTVKILDTWQNLQTPGFWKQQLQSERKDSKTVAKLLRARVLTNVAEFFGMREVASSMTRNLASVMNLNHIDEPMLSQLTKISPENLEEYERRQNELDSNMAEAQQIKESLNSMISKPGFEGREIGVSHQTPWGDPRDDAKQTPGTNIVYSVPSLGGASRITAFETDQISIRQEPLSIHDGVLRAEVLRLLGRETTDYTISDSQGNSKGRVRISDASRPNIISSLKVKEYDPSDILDSPEAKLFDPKICDFMGEDGIRDILGKHANPDLMGLVTFMFSPAAFAAQSGSGEKEEIENRHYVIFVNGKPFLASNKTTATLHEICANSGIPNATARILGGLEKHDVLPEDHHTLDDLEYWTNNYRVVVIEPKEQNGGEGTVYRREG